MTHSSKSLIKVLVVSQNLPEFVTDVSNKCTTALVFEKIMLVVLNSRQSIHNLVAVKHLIFYDEHW